MGRVYPPLTVMESPTFLAGTAPEAAAAIKSGLSVVLGCTMATAERFARVRQYGVVPRAFQVS
jgi:hypothetical protein